MNITLESNITFAVLVLFLTVYFINLLLSILIFVDSQWITNNFFDSFRFGLKKNKLDLYLLVFASFIGIPPLSGFISKFILSFLVFSKYGTHIVCTFYLVIALNVYFYIQYLRFIKQFELTSTDVLKHVTSRVKNKKEYKYVDLVLTNLCAAFIILFIFFTKDFAFILIFFLTK